MAAKKTFPQPDFCGAGTRYRQGRLEDHFIKPASSPVSDEPAQLPLRANENSVQNLYALGRGRPGTGIIPLFLSGDARATGIESGPGPKPSESDRILGVAGRIRNCGNRSYSARANSFKITETRSRRIEPNITAI